MTLLCACMCYNDYHQRDIRITINYELILGVAAVSKKLHQMEELKGVKEYNKEWNVTTIYSEAIDYYTAKV